MSSKKRKVGVRTYRRYSPGAFISGIFSLAIVACLGAFVVLPVISFTAEGEPTEVYKGLDIILLGVRRFYSGVVGDRFNSFLSYFNIYEGDNQLLKYVCNFHDYVELGIVGLYVFAAFLAFIEACLGVVWMVGGKISKPKATKSIGWAIFIFFGLSIMFFFVYLTFYSEILKAISDEASAVFNIYALAPLGGMFFSLIVLGITYKVCYKDRVYSGKKHNKNKDANIVMSEDTINVSEAQPQQAQMQPQMPQQSATINTSSTPVMVAPIPVPQQEVFLEEPVNVVEIPAGTTEIKDHAYAKNSSIFTIDIPEGVVLIGGGAFVNCHNLEKITFPKSLVEIGYNAFFDTPKLKIINYAGTKEDWIMVKRGSNWLTHSGTTIINTADGPITVNPNH